MMNISPPSNKKIFRWASFLLAFGLLNSLLARSVAAFTNPSLSILTRVPSTRYQPDMSLYFFRKDSKDGDDETKDADENDSNDSAEKSKNRLPFFGRLIKQMGPEDDVSTVSESTTTSTVVAPPKPLVKKTDDPVEIARALREQAERAKLEAERMDAALTLEKIEKLEKQLAKAKAKGSGNADNVSVEELQRQMDNLQAKLRGEAPKPVVIPKPESKKETEPSTAATSSADEKPKIELSNVQISFKKDDLMGNFDDIKKNVDLAPPFFQKLLATQVGYVYDSSEALNTTEIAVRLQQASVRDFSFSDKAKPEFSQEQIDREVQKIKNSDGDLLPVSDEMVRLADGNLTKLAIYGLEYNYYLSGDDLQQNLEEALNEDEFMDELKKAFNEAGIAEGLETIGSDSVISTLYPKCAYNEKEDDIPTAGQMSDFVSTVLTKTKFKATASPAKRLGGYIVRGTHNYENGDELIDAIDAAMQKSILKDKMTVLYTYDLFVDIINDEDLDQKIENFVDGEKETVLFVMAPNICREKKPVALSIVSAFGLASTWYLAVYPFLLNPTLAKRIEEQIELANSNMAFDLDFLTDMSVPLFYTFIGLQIIGEIAHSIVARQNGFKITAPTFVPSLITGVTSTVTTFKTLPKNKKQMFDFSVAGPLVGALGSLAAIALGSQLTLTSDPATLPALPLEILRQSTLGGGIIEAVLGSGSLSVPPGSLGTAAVSGMTIPLHPIALAGYISLFVHALSLLPIGTTDGGRMALALFGRGEKLLIGNLFVFALLLIGLTGSDLFLFYFAFIIACQTGNEVPARNEVDGLDFPRALLAVVAYSIAFLTLVPFQ